MSADGKLQCYNRCCGQTFDPAENKEDSCVHHPGMPVFHDAYKKWSCCEKKTTDFTEFLNIKGCTRSFHSNVKPIEPVKSPQKEIEVPPLPTPLEQVVVMERPDENTPLIPLSFTVGASLKPMLEKMKQEILLQPELNNDASVQLNTPCHNKGCREVYKGEQSNSETCMYHSGTPVFHEGMKYWSCCIKKTTDFNSFLDQVGCTTGKHKWRQDTTATPVSKCRYDWHQTGGYVIVSVYCKCPLPEDSLIEVNPVKLKMRISYGKEVFQEHMVLAGIVDVGASHVTYLGSKVEVKLKKAEAVAWKALSLRKHIDTDMTNLTLNEAS